MMSDVLIAASGRLGADPREHATRNGKTMAFANLAVNLPDRSRDAEKGAHETLWLSLVAFGNSAGVLLAHRKGDLLQVSGRMAYSRYTMGNGEDREQYQVTVESIVSAKAVRVHSSPSRSNFTPGPSANSQDPAPPRQAGQRRPVDDFDEDPPF